MHPLDRSLDQSLHDKTHSHPTKRRSSLDNSCLASAESFQQILALPKHELTSPKHARRLSLNNSVSVTTSFLAGVLEIRPKLELDLDFHSSVHSRTAPLRPGLSKLTNSESSNETFETADTTNDAADMSDEYSLDSCSDCDSFGEASVHELANKDYIRNNLGASVFWASNASMGDLKFEVNLGDIVLEEDEEDW